MLACDGAKYWIFVGHLEITTKRADELEVILELWRWRGAINRLYWTLMEV